MVLEGIFPQDERVEKEIASLLSDGHEVRIATYAFEKVQYMEKYQCYTIYRKRIGQMMYKMSAAILVLPFYFAFWRLYIRKIFKEWPFDAIHIHDLPLARLGKELKKKEGLVFVADQHEFYSDWIGKTAHYNSIPGRIIKYLSNWKKYEYRILKEADMVCTVEQPIKELYVKTHGIDEEKIIVLPNTPLKSVYSIKAKERSDHNFILFYCGGLDVLRGLKTSIHALVQLKEKIPEIKLSLVGKSNKHFDAVAFAASLGVSEYVDFRGWVHYCDLPKEIDKSDICFFIPPSNRDEINNTIATKIYQYMARGKPVIVGKARYMKEFVEKNRIGIAINEDSPQEFAAAVLKLYHSPAELKQFIKNAKLNIEQYYWENTVLEMLRFYRIEESRLNRRSN